MTGREKRAAKAEATAALRAAADTGFYRALTELLRLEIAVAHEEMEHAETEISIWRAQGRAAGARALLNAVTPRDAAE